MRQHREGKGTQTTPGYPFLTALCAARRGRQIDVSANYRNKNRKGLRQCLGPLPSPRYARLAGDDNFGFQKPQLVIPGLAMRQHREGKGTQKQLS